MKCKEAKTLLYEYLTSALDADARVAVEHHLNECPRCSNWLGELQTTLRLLDVLKPPQLGPDSKEKILQKIEEELKRREADSDVRYSLREDSVRFSIAYPKEPATPEPPEKQKKYTSLVIGIAVGAAILLALILALKTC